ncbi:MAG TPA: type I methionyl aminopeptidase [bacterium]|nr:type I methionyl aminopeptidase [bacterium]
MAREKIIIKNPAEIEGIRKSSRLAAETLDMIERYIEPGISTDELDHICNAFMIEHGARSACIDYLGNNRWGKGGYPKCTCISRNEVICHGIPNPDERLQDGDIVNIDVTTVLDGYFGDTSRTYLVGNVSAKKRKLVEVTEKAMYRGIEAIRPGGHIGDIGHAIMTYAEPLGYSVVREYTGHGTGVEFHEAPYIYHRAERGTGARIEPGMVFTVEPMINIGGYKTKLLDDDWTVKTQDGQPSAQFEHTILVTETGYEILTTTK